MLKPHLADGAIGYPHPNCASLENTDRLIRTCLADVHTSPHLAPISELCLTLLKHAEAAHNCLMHSMQLAAAGHVCCYEGVQRLNASHAQVQPGCSIYNCRMQCGDAPCTSPSALSLCRGLVHVSSAPGGIAPWHYSLMSSDYPDSSWKAKLALQLMTCCISALHQHVMHCC